MTTPNGMMAMSPDQIKEAFYKTNFTLKGRIFHPNLLTTRSKTNQTTGQTRDVYDVQFVWDPRDPANAAAMNQLTQFHNQMTQLCFMGVDPRALVNPFKADKVQGYQDYVRNDYKPNPEYCQGKLWINAESGKEFPPVVVNAQRQPVIHDAELYSGRNAVINFQMYPMHRDPQKPNKKIGFGVNLNAVMLMEGGEREGGSRQVDANAIFQGFAGDMGVPGQNFQQPVQTPQFPGMGQAPAHSFQQPPQAPQFPQQNFQQPQAPQAPYNPGQQQQYQQPQAPQVPAWNPNAPYNPNGNGQY